MANRTRVDQHGETFRGYASRMREALTPEQANWLKANALLLTPEFRPPSRVLETIESDTDLPYSWAQMGNYGWIVWNLRGLFLDNNGRRKPGERYYSGSTIEHVFAKASYPLAAQPTHNSTPEKPTQAAQPKQVASLTPLFIELTKGAQAAPPAPPNAYSMTADLVRVVQHYREHADFHEARAAQLRDAAKALEAAVESIGTIARMRPPKPSGAASDG